MKKHLLLFTLLSLLAFTQVGLGQTTYMWIGADGGSWATSTNWNPTRTTPATNDIIQFTAVNVTVPGVPIETIGQLNISSDAVVFLQSSSATALTINSSVIVDGSLNLEYVVFAGAGNFTLGATGTLKINNTEGISGLITLSGTKTFTDGASYFFYNSNTIHPFISSVVATNLTTQVMVTLNQDISVSGVVSIYSPLTLGTNNLTLLSGATVVGLYGSLGAGINYKMIVPSGSGELRKEFTSTGSFTFPVGATTPSNTYSPVTVNFTSGTFRADYVGVKLVNSKHPNNSSASNFINRYWTITQSGISSFSCDVTATYVDGDIAGTEANIYCGAYNGSAWTLYGATNTGSNQLTATAVTSFPADFTGGETSVLPVELTSFTALARSSKVELNWNTATEVKNYGFEIERISPHPSPSQGEGGEVRRGWQKIGFVQGNGNSNSPKEYSYTDNTTTSGKYVYRLKQLDNDGKYEYSKEVEADLGMPTEFSLQQNYPNPFNPETVINYQMPVSGKASLKVFDMLGREVATLVNEVKEAGTYNVSFNGKAFASGTYFYRFQSGDYVKIKKMILMK
jgi:hypothetical protein